MNNKLKGERRKEMDGPVNFKSRINHAGMQKKSMIFSTGPGEEFATFDYGKAGNHGVTPLEQPDMEITLMAISEGMMFKKDSARLMRDLVSNGTFGFCVFECNDLLATYEELKAKGVEFTKPPTKEFYAFEALFKDDSGNWFSLGEKK